MTIESTKVESLTTDAAMTRLRDTIFAHLDAPAHHDHGFYGVLRGTHFDSVFLPSSVRVIHDVLFVRNP